MNAEERRPTLRNFGPDDLRSVARLESLFSDAVARGLIDCSEASFLGFLSTAEYCLRVGTRPAALFSYLVKERRSVAALADEDRALRSLRQYRAEGRENCPWLIPMKIKCPSNGG